jgi:hypothetical protein
MKNRNPQAEEDLKLVEDFFEKVEIDDLINFAKELPLLKMQANKNVEGIILSKMFLQNASKDLETTKILYEHKIYNTAVFHLQQAVEKTTKAYALTFFTLSKRETRGVGHDTPLVFIELIERKWVKYLVNPLRRQFPHSKILDPDILEIKNLMRKKEEKKKLALLKEEQIKGWLELIKKITSTLTSSETKRRISEVLDYLRVEAEELKESDDINESQIGYGIEKQLTDLEKGVESFLLRGSYILTIYFLSIITYPHSTFTRYPSEKLNPSMYKSGLGIVDCLPNIMPLLNECIEELTTFFEKNELSNHNSIT